METQRLISYYWSLVKTTIRTLFFMVIYGNLFLALVVEMYPRQSPSFGINSCPILTNFSSTAITWASRVKGNYNYSCSVSIYIINVVTEYEKHDQNWLEYFVGGAFWKRWIAIVWVFNKSPKRCEFNIVTKEYWGVDIPGTLRFATS